MHGSALQENTCNGSSQGWEEDLPRMLFIRANLTVQSLSSQVLSNMRLTIHNIEPQQKGYLLSTLRLTSTTFTPNNGRLYKQSRQLLGRL